jgi:hypothetical protein
MRLILVTHHRELALYLRWATARTPTDRQCEIVIWPWWTATFRLRVEPASNTCASTLAHSRANFC